MLKAILLAVSVFALAIPVQAAACSVSGVKETRERLKKDPDNFLVRGTFTVEGEFRESGYPQIQNLIIIGEIDAVGDLSRQVWLEYNEFFAQCGIQFAPPIDAEGRFWLSREKTDGRHRIVMWEGRYLPEALERNRARNAEIEARDE